MQYILMTTPFRSGSGLVSRVLNAHSQISMTADKIKYFRFCFNRYGDNLELMLNDLSKRLSRRFNIKFVAKKCLERINHIVSQTVKPAFLPYKDSIIYSSILKQFYENTDNTIIGEMESLSWTRIPTFLDMFPKGKSFLVARDLRDVVVTFKESTISKGNDYLVAIFNIIDAMEHFQRFQSMFPDCFYGIKYEVFKADPVKETKNICRFLDVDYEPEMLNEDNWTEYYNNGWNAWENWQSSSFEDETKHLNPTGKWRELISEEDLFLCEWIGQKQMEAFGMKPEGKSISQNVFNRAIKKITSSPLLRECFRKWCLTGRGVEKYPLDPLNPKNWDKVFGVN